MDEYGEKLNEIRQILHDLSARIQVFINSIEKITTLYDTAFDSFAEYINNNNKYRLEKSRLIWNIVKFLIGLGVGIALGKLDQMWNIFGG